MLNKALVILGIWFALISFTVKAQQGQVVKTFAFPVKPVPKVKSKRAIVVDYATGTVLFAKNALERCSIASLQKMLTALCIQDRGNTNNRVKITLYDTKVVPSKLDLKVGHSYTRSALIKALLVKSGNDVARALARDAAGSEEKFAQVMNKKARALGMMHSHFKNPHGLTYKGQYSCAYDAAILARVAYHNRVLRSYMGTRKYTFTFADGKKRVLENTNKLLKWLSYCDGLKTGTTRASGKCLASSGTLNGRTAIVVCLGGDHVSCWQDSKNLLRWALERPAAQ